MAVKIKNAESIEVSNISKIIHVRADINEQDYETIMKLGKGVTKIRLPDKPYSWTDTVYTVKLDNDPFGWEIKMHQKRSED